MLSRRIIRIRAVQTFYAYYQGGIDSVEKAEHQLLEALNKTYDLYFYLMGLILEVVDYAKFKIEQGKQKLLPTYEDLHPNTKFIENQLVVQLRENYHLNQELSRIPYNWNEETDTQLIKKIYEKLTQSQQYKDYMQNEQRSYSEDKAIILHLVGEIFYNCDELYDNLEEKNIFWGDGVDYVIAMIYKTLQHFSIGDDMRKQLMPKFRSSADLIFAKQLLTLTILRTKQYLQILEDHIENWDISRLARLDVILLLLALHELLYMEEIPVKVTLDEYIDIAKSYSTHKSPAFINGILDKIVKKFEAEKLITKTGKGLL
jgi:N utilization substance protein B